MVNPLSHQARSYLYLLAIGVANGYGTECEKYPIARHFRVALDLFNTAAVSFSFQPASDTAIGCR
jgi:hypothetical protein